MTWQGNDVIFTWHFDFGFVHRDGHYFMDWTQYVEFCNHRYISVPEYVLRFEWLSLSLFLFWTACFQDYNKCVEEPGFCLNGSTCEQTWTSATCHCAYRYQGDRCHTCSERFQGEGCQDCSPRFKGENCKECSERFTGEECQECSSRFQGDECEECSERFQGVDCDECADGYYGDICGKKILLITCIFPIPFQRRI